MLLMNLSIFMFAFSEYASKWGYNNTLSKLSPIDFVMARSFFLILFGTIYAWKSKKRIIFQKKELILVYLRNFLGVITFLLFFYSLEHLALFLTTFVINLSPLFTALYGKLLLNENMSSLDSVNMTLSLGGVGIIVYGQTGHNELI